MVDGFIQFETSLTNDFSRTPDLGPKDELVGYGTKGYGGLRTIALFTTDVYKSARLIQIDGVRNNRIIGRNELGRSSFNLVERNDIRTLWIKKIVKERER